MKEDWVVTTLNDICVRITDGSHWSPKGIIEGIPMASVKDMTDFGLNVETCKRISAEDYQKLVKNDCKPQIDDVLIAKDGSYLKHVFAWKKNIDIAILSSIAILRPNKKIVEPEFLAKYLMSPVTKKAMSGYVTCSALPRIILKDFKNFQILLPPLTIQRKIAGILSAYDELIENNIRRIQILEEMAQRIS
ncbi:restriction endonuclease subunit S, partial [bacterium]|nr:restriction endonuclease subunit S [bacterium]